MCSECTQYIRTTIPALGQKVVGGTLTSGWEIGLDYGVRSRRDELDCTIKYVPGSSSGRMEGMEGRMEKWPKT